MARIIYPGLEDYLFGSFTIGHGITPGIGTIYVPWRTGRLFKKIGNLTFQDGSGSVTFPNCTIDSVSVEVDDQGYQIAAVTILDRRWKWRTTGQISGYYNIRRGKDLVAYSKKNARELAKLCLTAIGETGFDLSQMPDNTFPEVAWEYTLPALALAELCESVGCRIVLTLQNRVAIRRVGVGALLPPDFLHAAQTLDPPELPSELRFVGDRIRMQRDLALECVMPELDGELKPLDKVSYTPNVFGVKTWRRFNPGFVPAIPKKEVRALCLKWLYKLYRVKVPFDKPYTLGLVNQTVEIDPKSIEQILPLETEQIETEIASRIPGRPIEPRRKAAQLFGQFVLDASSRKNNYDSIGGRTPDLVKWPDQVYQRGWQFDNERGLIVASEPLYRIEKGVPPKLTWQDKNAAGAVINRSMDNLFYHPADLKLRTTIGYRDKDTLAWLHWEVKRKLGNNGTLPEFVVRSDVEMTLFYDWSHGGTVVDSHAEYEQQANHYLDARMLELQNPQPASATYAGFRGINLDGAIQQVTFEVDRQGFAYTRASRNREESFVTPSYQERRLYERQRALEDASRKAAVAARRKRS